MELFLKWAGAIGAWLLVAGPLYQGALELAESEHQFSIDDDETPITDDARVASSGPSSWWWVLPPIAVSLIWIEDRRLKRLWEAKWSETERAAFLHFTHRATGWLVVSAGAFLIALEATWSVTHRHGWSTTMFWLIVVVLSAVSFVGTATAIGRATRSRT